MSKNEKCRIIKSMNHLDCELRDVRNGGFYLSDKQAELRDIFNDIFNIIGVDLESECFDFVTVDGCTLEQALNYTMIDIKNIIINIIIGYHPIY